MKKIFASIVTVCFLFILVGCGKSNKLIGTWKGATQDGLKTTFKFEKNDKVTYENEYGFNSTGTYKITDDKVEISLESWSEAKVYKFEVKDGKLNLTATDQYSPSYAGMTKSK